MRIIAGKHKGRRIETPNNAVSIRPTSDFARQAIFNIVAHGVYADRLIDGHVADVFCGTGAFGLEALSRGAASVAFIDHSRDSMALARKNVVAMHEEANSQFIHCDAAHMPKAKVACSLLFLDPPYNNKLIPKALVSLKENGWIAPDALIIAEHDEKEIITLPEGFRLLEERRYGRAKLMLIELE